MTRIKDTERLMWRQVNISGVCVEEVPNIGGVCVEEVPNLCVPRRFQKFNKIYNLARSYLMNILESQ